VVKAPCAKPTLFAKCAEDARLGANQYPSHLMQGRGGKIWPSRHMAGGEGVPVGSLCRGVLQWMSTILGTLKPASRALAWAQICLNALCRILTFVLYDGDAADNAKLSTYNTERILLRSI